MNFNICDDQSERVALLLMAIDTYIKLHMSNK